MSPSRVLRHGSWWIGAAVGLAALVLSVRAQPLSPEGIGDRGAPVNVMCPVMPDEPIDPRSCSYTHLTLPPIHSV